MNGDLTSADQLDALPTGAVVRDAYGDEWRKIDGRYWEWLVDEDAHSSLSREIPMPATRITKDAGKG